MGEDVVWFGAGQDQDPLLPTMPGAEHAAESPSHPQMASTFPSAAPALNQAQISHEDKNHLSHSWWFVGAKLVPGRDVSVMTAGRALPSGAGGWAQAGVRDRW